MNQVIPENEIFQYDNLTDEQSEFVERFNLRKYKRRTHDNNLSVLQTDPDVSKEDKSEAFVTDPFITEEHRAYRIQLDANWKRREANEFDDSDMDFGNFTEEHPDYPDHDNVRVNPETGSMIIFD